MYDTKSWAHQQLRAKLLPYAYGRPCPRCGAVMLEGQALELDHTNDRTGYLGMSHRWCNRSHGGRKGIKVTRAIMRRRAALRRASFQRW
jgi:hypothetical protein